MTKIVLPQHAYVLVGDGRKALVLRNDGDEKFPNLKVERVFEQDNPPTHAQGTDRPGRAFASVGMHRSGTEQTDWHDLEEQRFARTVADAFERLVRANKTKALVVVAPARTLAQLRDAFHPDVAARIIAELDKDLTKHPVHEIERHLTVG